MATKKSYRIRSTEKNKDLDPMIAGGLIFGYDPEIHGEDSYEFTYNLPLGAIKRLIKSYFEDMEIFDQEAVYLSQSGSHGLRMYSYASRMLEDLEKQLINHKLHGKKIVDDVFDMYFKKSYDKMKRHQKNHPNQALDNFERCNDSECCLPLSKKQKVTQLLRFFHYTPRRWFWEIKRRIRTRKNLIVKMESVEDIPF